MTFWILSTIDIVRTLNSNAEALSVEELVEAAKSHLMNSDIYATYGLPLDYLQKLEYGEDLICKIEINQIRYSLGRLEFPGQQNRFLYVPVLVCSGRADYYGKDTGNMYVSSSEFGLDGQDLVLVNAVDGTIIYQ